MRNLFSKLTLLASLALALSAQANYEQYQNCRDGGLHSDNLDPGTNGRVWTKASWPIVVEELPNGLFQISPTPEVNITISLTNNPTVVYTNIDPPGIWIPTNNYPPLGSVRTRKETVVVNQNGIVDSMCEGVKYTTFVRLNRTGSMDFTLTATNFLCGCPTNRGTNMPPEPVIRSDSTSITRRTNEFINYATRDQFKVTSIWNPVGENCEGDVHPDVRSYNIDGFSDREITNQPAPTQVFPPFNLNNAFVPNGTNESGATNWLHAVRLNWQSEENHQYVVQYKYNLNATNWTTAEPGVIDIDTGESDPSWTEWVAPMESKFYRIMDLYYADDAAYDAAITNTTDPGDYVLIEFNPDGGAGTNSCPGCNPPEPSLMMQQGGADLLYFNTDRGDWYYDNAPLIMYPPGYFREERDGLLK